MTRHAKQPHAVVVDRIVDLLTAYNIRATTVHGGGAKASGGGFRLFGARTHLPTGKGHESISGWPDVAIWVPGEPGWGRLAYIEVKVGADRLSDGQKRWHAEALRHGFPVHVVHVRTAAEADAAAAMALEIARAEMRRGKEAA